MARGSDKEPSHVCADVIASRSSRPASVTTQVGGCTAIAVGERREAISRSHPPSWNVGVCSSFETRSRACRIDVSHTEGIPRPASRPKPLGGADANCSALRRIATPGGAQQRPPRPDECAEPNHVPPNREELGVDFLTAGQCRPVGAVQLKKRRKDKGRSRLFSRPGGAGARLARLDDSGRPAKRKCPVSPMGEGLSSQIRAVTPDAVVLIGRHARASLPGAPIRARDRVIPRPVPGRSRLCRDRATRPDG